MAGSSRPPSSCRLDHGGLIDRAKPVSFTFNGRNYTGFEGDTLASALLAHGVHLNGRSFKYHRPRGIAGAGYEEPATLVQLTGDEDVPNMPVTRVRLRNGLQARSVNCWPSPQFDLGSIAQLFSRFLPAGFYYKTFMWPDWHLFEPFIRRAAGLGRAPSRPPAGIQYETRYHHCDVLVVGAGPAGLMAALVAGEAGARVLLVDDDTHPGGRLNADGGTVAGEPAQAWVHDVVARLKALETVEYLRDATAWAVHEHGFVMVTERALGPRHLLQRTRRVRAAQVVVAAGAIERPIPFADNDRPGVMLASAVSTYAGRYGVAPGRRAVVFTNNDSAYHCAFLLKRSGLEAVTVVDARAAPGQDLIERARAAGIAVEPGHVVRGIAGARHVRGAVIARTGADVDTRTIPCDLVCVSGGWNPAVHLFSQSRGTVRYDDRLATFVPGEPAQAVVCAGSANGVFDLGGCLADGAWAGAEAARACGRTPADVAKPEACGNDTLNVEPLWFVEPVRPGAKVFLDIQNDVTLEDVRLAIREGFSAVEHVKRYTTAGMGVDQGKTGNVNVIGAVAQTVARAPGEIGTTTFRPPYVPVEFGAIAGHRPGALILPYRHTPMTGWHKARGAEMYEAGARWRRPGYYPLEGESFQETVNRESRAVRESVGIYDGSPLGKFDIRGPDALKLLELVYTNAWESLVAGNGRYGLMLTDDGLVFDDGVTFKLGPDHYLMTTATGNADLAHRKLEELLQVHRPHWQVVITPVTTQWANATVCGPLARQVLEAAGTDIDLANRAFPFMSLREGQVAGLGARVCRVSFTGELSYEINVPARHGLELWEKLMAAGTTFGITPVGSEANHVLRVEKGFLSLGHEADATADPYDLGMGWIVSRKKPDFLGKRAMEIRRAASGPRRELVGLLPADPGLLVTEGAPLTPGGARQKTEGFVSACVWSVVRNRTVALGLLAGGRGRIGQTAHIRLKDRVIEAEVTAPVFHDPDGALLRS